MTQVDADVLILGAGPAGLSAAQYGSRANLKALVIEQLSPGGQVLSIDKLENYPGDLNPRSGYDFAEDMRKQAENFGAQIIGDAACDEARFLSLLTDRVILVHRRDSFRAQAGLVQRTLQNPRIDVRLNTRPLEIRGDKQVTSVILENTITQERHEEPVNAVFIFAGTIPQTALIPDDWNQGSFTDEAGYIITDQRMESAIPGLFAAGDVRSSPFRQVVVAAAEGAIAAHCAAEYIDKLKA
jgi:thioredoxin reductase